MIRIGAGFIAQVEVAETKRRNMVERSPLSAKIKIVGRSSTIVAGSIGLRLAQQHQAIEFRKRIGPEEKTIDCAEDCAVCAKAER
jgi:hypothetical protein